MAGLDLNEKGGSYYQDRERREITYNAFKKPTEIYEENEGRVSFGYSPLQQRSHAWYGGTAENKEERRFRKHYSSISPVEIVEDRQTGNTKIITYVGGDQYSATVVHIKQSTPPMGQPEGAYHYLHRDYLGSILAITDDNGNIVEQNQFGAWGTVDKHLNNGTETEFGVDSLLGRGYTGHEHFLSVSLIHMNGRMYDAELGRFLSPDNYVQDPYNTQNFNRYGYVLNNPLNYSDPSGEEFFTAVVIAGAIIGAAVGAATYIGVAARTGNWNWGQFGLSVLSGAVVGALTSGQLPAAISVGYVASAVGAGLIAGVVPGINIRTGNWNFSISPALAFGNASGIGANLSVGFNDGNFSASIGFGASFYGSAHGTGASGWEFRKSWGVNWDDGKNRVGLYSTSFNSGETSQRVGGLSYGNGDFGFRYENDGAPFNLLGTTVVGKDSDRFRTAAIQLSYKDFSAGFNLFTGNPRLDGEKQGVEPLAGHPNRGDKLGGQYAGPNASRYRLGAAYIGYKGFRVGRHSEAIRHTIQNRVAHDIISYQPYFKVLDIAPQGYFQYQSANPFTLW